MSISRLFKLLIISTLLILASGWLIFNSRENNNPEPNQDSTSTTNFDSSNTTTPVGADIKEEKKPVMLMDGAVERVTKKHFGLYVTPQNSPVSPEKFQGYHTGVDFEVSADEQDLDIPVFALCDGPLLVKRSVNGYGGVAVQSCEFDDNPVTVIYGHLKLSSIEVSSKDMIVTGDKIGFLGKAYRVETSGERKHLHLGISRGTAINYAGYVKNEADLKNWLDPLMFLQ